MKMTLMFQVVIRGTNEPMSDIHTRDITEWYRSMRIKIPEDSMPKEALFRLAAGDSCDLFSSGEAPVYPEAVEAVKSILWGRVLLDWCVVEEDTP